MLEVTRFDQAKTYDAKNHFAMTAMRLQGEGVSGLQNSWVGYSTFLPGGGADKGAAPTPKVYVVLEGEITITTAEGDTVLQQYDSCYLPPNLQRSVINRTNYPVKMLVISFD